METNFKALARIGISVALLGLAPFGFAATTPPSISSTPKPWLLEVVVSEQLPKQQVVDAFHATLTLFEQRLCGAKDTLIVSTGSGRRIAKIEMPAAIQGCGGKFETWKQKIAGAELIRAATFFRGLVERDYADSEPGALSIPDVLDFVAKRLPEYPSHRQEIIIFGTAIHRDAKAGIDLSDAFFTDAHLDDPFSPWTVRGREKAITGASVHIIHQPGEFNSDLHRDMLSRATAVFIDGLGGQLVSVSADPHVIDRLRTPPLPSMGSQRNPHEKEVAIVSLRRKVMPTQVVSNVSAGDPDLMVIWIEWDGAPDIDLDLYIPRPRACNIEISKEHPVCTSGVHPIQAQREGNDHTGYDKVIVRPPIPEPGTLLVAVNYAAGQGPASAEFFVQFQGETHQTNLDFSAQQGNGGAANGTPGTWVEVDLAQLLAQR